MQRVQRGGRRPRDQVGELEHELGLHGVAAGRVRAGHHVAVGDGLEHLALEPDVRRHHQVRGVARQRPAAGHLPRRRLGGAGETADQLAGQVLQRGQAAVRPVVRRGPPRQPTSRSTAASTSAALSPPGSARRPASASSRRSAGSASCSRRRVTGVHGVLEVVHGVGDVVRPVHDLRLEAPGALRRAGPEPVEHLPVVVVDAELVASCTVRCPHGYLHDASSEARVRLSPTLRPVGARRPWPPAGSGCAGSARCPRSLRTRRATDASAASPVCPNGGCPRSWARHAVSTRSGSAPRTWPIPRPICAHSSEWVSRVRGKSLSPGTTTWVLSARRRSADEWSTRARSRS